VKKNSLLEYSLVIIQFSTIGYVYLTTSWSLVPAWCWLFIVIGGMIAGWAIGTMQLDNLRITPSPAEKTRLIMKGPYRIVRHPMYLSLLFIMFPPVIAQFSQFRLIMSILMVIDLVIKLNYEEKLLSLKFEEYVSYRKKTFRLIPFIY
jgi:protein-S-isoprenylcysteine O-methyltransferase Ste14